MPQRTLSSNYHYIKLAITPPCKDAITLRKSIQGGLSQSFGLTSANIYVDILWVASEGAETVIRVSSNEAPKVMAAVVTSTDSPNLSVIKDSPFLPSLCVTTGNRNLGQSST
ncbi:hypothetical protein QCA50_008311 [Cerrena zonata]|uniref:Ribonucleases P/MRP subunit Pop8-like domain-containing protein n=1 Tax=Cerrena zonata TaxID=2478898 RepID=A0AAW0GB29_9APHY